MTNPETSQSKNRTSEVVRVKVTLPVWDHTRILLSTYEVFTDLVRERLGHRLAFEAANPETPEDIKRSLIASYNHPEVMRNGKSTKHMIALNAELVREVEEHAAKYALSRSQYITAVVLGYDPAVLLTDSERGQQRRVDKASEKVG